MSSFTCEDDFMHYTQNENHGSRRVGLSIGATGKLYKGRKRRMTSFNEEAFSAKFESMSIRTQFSESLNEANICPPYMMGYGQPSQNYVLTSSSTNEGYSMSNYSHLTQMSYHVPHQMQEGFEQSI